MKKLNTFAILLVLNLLDEIFSMKRLFFFICFCLTTYCLQGKIIETENFSEIINYAHLETLVILDIDDTLLIPVQTLGTDVWFISKLKKYTQTIQNPSLALDKALAEWEAIRHITKVKIVEEGTEAIIDQMQKEHIVIMGLTTQGLALATRTLMQLRSLGIDLSKTAPSSQDEYFINGEHGVLYRQGILFTSGSAKGEALFKLLDKIHYSPKRIVFINDKQAHLEDVETSTTSKKIDFTGLRYRYSDLRVKNFRQDIADIQWNYSTFEHILSDEEAASLLNFEIDSNGKRGYFQAL